MFARVVQKPDHVVVVEGVVRKPAGPAHPDQTRGAEKPELMRHRRLGHADERRQVADATFAVRQGVNQPHACGIAQQLENVGNRLDRARTQKTRLDALEGGNVRPVRRGARHINGGVGSVCGQAHII